jgi:hypothetical protein
MLISSGTLSLPFCRVVRQVAPITSYVHKLNNITNAVLMRLKTEIFTTAKGHKPTMTPYGEDAKTLTSRICDAIIASSSLGAFRIFCIARIFQHIPNSKFSALYSRGVLEIYYLYNTDLYEISLWLLWLWLRVCLSSPGARSRPCVPEQEK